MECVAHMHKVEDDCEYCQGEIDGLVKQYHKQIEHNTKIEQDLNRQGVGVAPEAFIMTRINAVVAVVFGENVKGRTKFEIEYAKHCEQLLMEAQKQGARAKLTQGINGVKLPK